MAERREFRYVVVGLGGLGSSAAYRLAKRAGTEVLGLERFELGHERGASQDHSRLIRLSYHTPEYVRLAKAAYEAWGEVEAESGERLILKTGGVDLYPPGAAISMDGYAKSLDAEGVPYEVIDAAGTMRRWPQFRLDEDVTAMFQEDTGVVAAARCNDAHRRLAREHGATLRDRARVTAIRDTSGGFEVEARGVTYSCEKLVICADAWTNELLAHLGWRIPLTVTQEQVAYFAAPNLEEFRPGRFPIWIWMDDPSFYGFPVFGEEGTKIGQDAGGREVTGDTRSFEPDPEYHARLEAFMQRVVPDGFGPLIEAKTCLYTMTPDRDFVMGAVPGHPGALVAQGAAHAFKFASVIGRTLADLAVDGRTGQDLSPFRMDRAVLLMEQPPRRFLV